ncbi:chaperone protein ClpB [Staphylococcus aureus]|uniref:Chaperone protein ClpB n=1 Tax=Staphylococcus aureus TaxID=1280 RepID=A0A380DQ01_STAAU|nr:chaperone protein ClpB [Staphylococcus aureus]
MQTIRTEMGSNPTELDQVNRRVMQLEIEESALKNESDNASKQRLQELQKACNEKEKQQHFNLV